jgi:hypothetical protein
MSVEKRPASTSGDPRPMKRMSLTNSQVIFNGDEEKHRIADEAVRRTLGENSSVVLASLLSAVVLKLPGMEPPSVDAIVRELEKDPEFRDLVTKCLEDKDYKSIRNLCRFLYSVDLYCAHVTSQFGIVIRPL